MAHVQVLRHLLLLSFGHTLVRLGFDLKDELDISGSWFKMLIGTLASQLRQSPDLTADMVCYNPMVQEVSEGFCKTVEGVYQSIASKDRRALTAMIEETASYIDSAGCQPFRIDD